MKLIQSKSNYFHLFCYRNEVWRYNQKAWGHPRTRIFKFLFVGFPLGAACAAATIAFEEYFEVYKHEHDHAHGSASHH